MRRGAPARARAALWYKRPMTPDPRPGPVDRFLRRVQRGIDEGSFVELRLRPDEGPPVEVRLVTLAAGPALSFVTHEERRDVTENADVAAGLARIAAATQRAGSAWFAATGGSWQLIVPRQGRPRSVAHRTSAAKPDRGHDRPKDRIVTREGRDWLAALDLVDERGRPRPGRGDKLRQIERYADLLGHFAAECGWRAGEPVTVVDMGCGKGYLTFAAWHLFRRVLKLEARVLGVDAQPGVIASCEEARRRVGAEGLAFRAGSILDVELPRPDVLLALHACNDATDHALRRGVEAGARLIVVAPCCHKDLRRILGAPEPLAPLLDHGLFKGQFADWLTDGLRALALEAAGYRVKVAEFVAPEHTPKNTLIAGIHGTSAARRAEAARHYAAVKTWAALGPLPADALWAGSTPAH